MSNHTSGLGFNSVVSNLLASPSKQLQLFQGSNNVSQTIKACVKRFFHFEIKKDLRFTICLSVSILKMLV